MMRKILRLALLSCASVSLHAFEGYLPSGPIKPWFTGPLLTASGNTAGPGSWNMQPYVFLFARDGFYNSNWKARSDTTFWTLEHRLPVWIGIGGWMDFKIAPQWSWRYCDGQAKWTFDDLMLQASFQLYRDRIPHPNWLPSMKLVVRETCPTGKYQHLSARKNRTDVGGQGAWITTFAFCTSKVFHFFDFQFLNIEFNAAYSIPTTVHVKGLNFYGGGKGTDGTVTPGKFGQINFAFEYEFARHWCFAFDAVGLFFGSTHFSGKRGIVFNGVTSDGVPATNERDAGIQYSLAPAIEYNWSEDIGLIVGSWFTVAGKNAAQFVSGVAALNITF